MLSTASQLSPFLDHGGDLDMLDEFAGFGGSTQGSNLVPGVRLRMAANHDPIAIEHHKMNFPWADHQGGDIEDAKIEKWPACHGFWASPACPTWTDSRGVKRDFDKTNQTVLFGPDGPEENVRRSRALMEQVPRYLRAMNRRGKPVLFGVVENVIQCRHWDEWSRWIREIQAEGYKVRVIAINSMHAEGVRTARAPQSRDRLYVAYWHKKLGRDPDWDKWLRPTAYCPTCDEMIQAVQSWKKPGQDMGRYGVQHGQYVYRCPRRACRNQIVHPGVVPAAAVINWSNLGERIGDRAEDLKPKTRARIAAGLQKFAQPITLAAAGHTFERRPGVRTWPVSGQLTTIDTTESKALAVGDGMLVPTGGTWRDDATSVDGPMPARTTRESDAFVLRQYTPRGSLQQMATSVQDHLPSLTGSTVPRLVVPLEGRDGVSARTADGPFRTATARAQDALVVPLRNHGTAQPATEAPLPTIAASGTHHAMVMRNYSSTGDGGEHCSSSDEPIRTLTSKGHQSVVAWKATWGTPAGARPEHLVYAYDTGALRPAGEHPLPTQTSRDGDALLSVADWSAAEIDALVDDCLFRMLTPREIADGMAFSRGYRTRPGLAKRYEIRGYGNAVTPPVAEIIVSALVEAVTGEQLPRYSWELAA